MNLNLNKKEKELLMYCVLAFTTGYLMCMYFPVHGGRVTQAPVPMPILEGLTQQEANKMSRQELINEVMKGNGCHNHSNNNNNNNNTNKNSNNSNNSNTNKNSNNSNTNKNSNNSIKKVNNNNGNK